MFKRIKLSYQIGDECIFNIYAKHRTNLEVTDFVITPHLVDSFTTLIAQDYAAALMDAIVWIEKELKPRFLGTCVLDFYRQEDFLVAKDSST